MPVLLFLGTAFVFSNRGNSFAYIKLGAGVGFSFMLCTFLQLLTVPFEKEQTIISFYRYAAKEKKGGGLLGGIFTKLLCPAVGVAGTYVIVIILMIIFLVLITEKSFFKRAEKGQCKSLHICAKEDVRKRRTQASAKKEARAEKEETKAIKEAQKAAKREIKKASKAKADQHNIRCDI